MIFIWTDQNVEFKTVGIKVFFLDAFIKREHVFAVFIDMENHDTSGDMM